MRNIMIRKLKLLAALVVLGGMPLSGMCNDKQSVVTISATVTKDCTVAVDTQNVEFGEKSGFDTNNFPSRDVNVTTNCAGGTGKLTLLASESEGSAIVLSTEAATTGTGYSNKLKVDFKIGNDSYTFDSSKKVFYTVGAGNKNTKLTLKPVSNQRLIAGVYKGSLTITVEAV